MVSPEDLVKYAEALNVAANEKADTFSEKLVLVLGEADIPVEKIMVSAYHQAGRNMAEFVVIFNGDQLSLTRRIFQASTRLLAEEGNREMNILTLSSTTPGALEPEHYFPGYRTAFPPATPSS